MYPFECLFKRRRVVGAGAYIRNSSARKRYAKRIGNIEIDAKRADQVILYGYRANDIIFGVRFAPFSLNYLLIASLGPSLIENDSGNGAHGRLQRFLESGGIKRIKRVDNRLGRTHG